MGHAVLGHEVFDNEDPRRLSCRLADVRQDLNALLVIPIMKDHLKAVRVGLRYGVEHVPSHVLASLLSPSLVAHSSSVSSTTVARSRTIPRKSGFAWSNA